MGSKNKTKTKTKPENSPAGGANHHYGGGAKLISDPRFASVHSDPRFREAPKRKSKISIDSRFSRMFSDKNFASSKALIDKRGKTKKRAENKLMRYYSIDKDDEGEVKLKNKNRKVKEELREEEIDEEEEDKVKNRKRKVMKESSDDDVSKYDSDDEEEELKVKKVLDVKRGLESLEDEEEEYEGDSEEEDEGESDGDSSSTSSSDSEDGEGYVEDDDDGAFAQEENIPEIDKETHRLAIVNMDWSQVKAADLYVLLTSFLPKEGQIKSVAVYPSEFGLQRMEEEAVRGPVWLFDDDNDKEDDDDDDDEINEKKDVNDKEDDNNDEINEKKDDNDKEDDDDDDDEINEKKDDNDKEDDDDDDDDDDDEINEKKLREYQLSRLRYYYAVVECDSIATADHLYKTCDGVELERSAVKLDLRFIPDSMELKHQPRDVAKEAPSSYDGLDFETRALQQTKVDMSWDSDDPQRKKSLRRKFNDEQLDLLELKEFMASDESETDDDESDNDVADKSTKTRKKQDMYRALLQSGEGSGGSEDEEGQDMEVTFNTGLEDISKRILEKKDNKSETVWEAYLRKRKEKKKGRKTNAKSSNDEISDSDQEIVEPDDFFIEEPSTKVKEAGKCVPTAKKKSETAEAEASRAELELLLADDNGADSSLKGFNLKRMKAKGKKGKEIPDESKIPTGNYEDPRFSQLFNSPDFALDPTDPQFKRSATYARQLVQKERNGDVPDVTGNKQAEKPSQTLISGKSVGKDEHPQSDSLPAKNQKPELSLMVKSIKMKAKQHRVSDNEVSRLLPAPKRRKK